MRTAIRSVLVLALASFSLAPQAGAFPRPGWSPYQVQVVVDGQPVREFVHRGRYYVLGHRGRRYALRVRNNTDRRVEVVATIDGLDVLDGKPGDFVNKRGYILGPWQTYDIEGFRLDMSRVAAFRFSSVRDSYAAKTGHARNVGVIGVAFFTEREVTPPSPPPEAVYPQDQLGDEGAVGGRTKSFGSEKSRPRFADATGEGGLAGTSAPAPSATPEPAANAAPPAPVASEMAKAEPSRRAHRAASRPGLGTAFGEVRESDVGTTDFVRAHPTRPAEAVTIYYNDRKGLLALGVPVGQPQSSDLWERETANPFPANPVCSQFATPPPGWEP